MDLDKGKFSPFNLSFEKNKASLNFARQIKPRPIKLRGRKKPNGNVGSPCLGTLNLNSILDWNGNP